MAKRINEIYLELLQKVLEEIEKSLEKGEISKEEFEVRQNEISNQIIDIYEKIKEQNKNSNA